jgi:hypothetical protein
LIPVKGRDEPLVDAAVGDVDDEIEDELHRLAVEQGPP